MTWRRRCHSGARVARSPRETMSMRGLSSSAPGGADSSAQQGLDPDQSDRIRMTPAGAPCRRTKRRVRMHVLLIGIDSYGGQITPLNGCVNDIDAMQRILVDRLGIDRAQITRLTSPHEGTVHETDV